VATSGDLTLAIDSERLIRLDLENFKGFESLSASFGTFNLLVGSNNSGKSQILQAIKWGDSLLRLHYPNPNSSTSQPGRTFPISLLPVASCVSPFSLPPSFPVGGPAVLAREFCAAAGRRSLSPAEVWGAPRDSNLESRVESLGVIFRESSPTDSQRCWRCFTPDSYLSLQCWFSSRLPNVNTFVNTSTAQCTQTYANLAHSPATSMPTDQHIHDFCSSSASQ
jgi:hypothetical protein